MVVVVMKEPTWGQELIIKLNTWMNNDPMLTKIMPISADIFVFLYPVFLVVWYVLGIVKKNIDYKKSAVFIFFAAVFCIIVNLIIQFFAFKSRPEFILDGLSEKEETILHAFLPQGSFPSDHAALSMGIAIATLVMGIKQKNTTLKVIGVLFVVFSLVMAFSRVVIGVHWPTDVIAGITIGVIVPLILVNKPIYKFFDKILFSPLIKFQEWILGR